ncbi:hypothetical protein [Nocardioides terrisoli]|uniref:hypothetical protein n=1 Tax=Nocardioides terrisoli TaxID=3388267 RepID=UPI00287B92F4|nr:hypothetical protein [Nocardioides marmorisolisilvae]
MGEARAAWRHWVTQRLVDDVVDDLVDLPGWALASPDEAKAVLGALASMTESEPDAITALVWALLPGAEKVARRLRDMSDDIDGLVASQLWIEAVAAYRLTTPNIAGAIVGQTQREVLADLGAGDLAVRRDRAMAQVVGDPDVLDEMACIELEDDPGPVLVEVFHVGQEEAAINGFDYWLLWALAAEADRQNAPARRGRTGLVAPTVVEAVAAEANLAPRSLRKRAARALDRLIEYVDARDDPQRYAEWKAQHRERELTIWDEMDLTLVEAEEERFRLDHPGMTSKQLRVAFNVVLGTRRRSATPREWKALLESDAG